MGVGINFSGLAGAMWQPLINFTTYFQDVSKEIN